MLELVDYRKVHTDQAAGTVVMGRDDMELDLGGVAKGWIADRIAEFLLDRGERHVLINLGGNVRVAGGKPGGVPYKIGMQDPFDDRGSYLGIFSLEDGSVVSSGVYERYFEEDGVRYHHIIKPSTGTPASGVHSATVFGPDAVITDALSTSVFVLGVDEGLKLIGTLPDYESIVIDAEGRVYYSDGLQQPAADDFR